MFWLKALVLSLPPITRTLFAVSVIGKLLPKREENPTITSMGTLMCLIARHQKSFTNETLTSRAGKALLTPQPPARICGTTTSPSLCQSSEVDLAEHAELRTVLGSVCEP
jgi:hypothetical protein